MNGEVNLKIQKLDQESVVIDFLQEEDIFESKEESKEREGMSG